MRNWYAGPWQWLTTPMPHWAPPAGFAALDFRPLPQQAQQGGTPGIGLFVGEGIITDSSYTHMGQGSWYDLKPTGRAKNALPKRPGYAVKGDDLVGMILDLLTDGADPEGLDGPKPIMPTTRGKIELHLGQRHSERFRWGAWHTPHLRHLIRKRFRELFEDAQAGKLKDAKHHRRYLDDICIKFGVEDWREFVPPDLVAHVPGREPRETTITENFTRADSTTLIGNQLTWTQVSGTWGNFANTGYKVATNGTNQVVRADSDLSSDDHYAQAVLSPPGSSSLGDRFTFYGPACRFSSSAATCYLTGSFDNQQYITKIVGGTATNLANAGYTYANNETHKVEADGSTLKCYVGGAEKVSATDSSITGNLRTGLQSFGVNATMDNFEAADLGGGGGGGVVYTQLERTTRGLFRGTFTGS